MRIMVSCEELDKYRKYEAEKAKLSRLCLTPEEYASRLRDIAGRIGL